MRRELQPCGTPAAYRRHKRRNEPACAACKAAEVRSRVRVPTALVADHREIRNHLPFVPYIWRDPARLTPGRLAELDAIDEFEAALEPLGLFAAERREAAIRHLPKLLRALREVPEGIAS